MRFAFTDLALKNLKPEAGYCWDIVLPGFGIAVGKKARTFVAVKNGRRTKLGRYPQTKLADARRRAAELLTTDADPTDITLSNAVSEYLESITTRERTKYEYKRVLNRHFVSTLGKRKIADLTARDILAVTDKLLKTPTECRHAHVAAQTFFNWCVPRYLSASPMTGLKSPTKPRKRARVLSDDELRAIWHACPQMGDFGVMVQLCILTGQRRGEMAAIQPAWIKAETLTIPAVVAKNRREHTIPLTTRALGLAKRAPLTVGNWGRKKAELDKLCGVFHWVLHDIRRSFATNLATLKVPPHVCERILNHATGEISQLAAIYNRHDYFEEMQDAMKRYDEKLTQLFNPA